MARKRPRRNKSKKRRAERLRKLAQRARQVSLTVGLVAALVLVSALFILVHDVLTRSEAFPVERIEISGAEKLSASQVMARAGVRKGDNILAVNLARVRKRLISHPWIADAQVRREVPGGIWIRVREHRCLAIVDLGDKFLLNLDGHIFKQWEPEADPGHLPVVVGLAAADLQVAAMPRAARRYSWPGSAEASAGRSSGAGAPLAAVMQVLRLGRAPDSAVPNRELKRIDVDRSMGLTLHAFERPKTINLGYDDYPRKYRMLATMLAEAESNRLVPDFTHIDLQDINRVVIKPAKQNPS